MRSSTLEKKEQKKHNPLLLVLLIMNGLFAVFSSSNEIYSLITKSRQNVSFFSELFIFLFPWSAAAMFLCLYLRSKPNIHNTVQPVQNDSLPTSLQKNDPRPKETVSKVSTVGLPEKNRVPNDISKSNIDRYISEIMPNLRELNEECKYQISATKKIGFCSNLRFEREYTCKKNHFNPLIEAELMAIYLGSIGLPGLKGKYKNSEYKVEFCDMQHEIGSVSQLLQFSVSFSIDNEAGFFEFCSLIDDYLESGYSFDESVLKEIYEKFTPVRMESGSYFSGWHDENNNYIRLYNSVEKLIIDISIREWCDDGLEEFGRHLIENSYFSLTLK